MTIYSRQDKEIKSYFDALSDIRNEILNEEHNIVAISGRDCKENLLISFGAFIEWVTSNSCGHAILYFPTVRHAWETLEEWESFHNYQMVREKDKAKRQFRIGNKWFCIQSSRTKVSMEAQDISAIYICNIPIDSPSNQKIARIYASIDKSALHKVVDVRSLGWAIYLIHDDIIAKKSLQIITSKFVNMGRPQYSRLLYDRIPSTTDMKEFSFNLRQEASKWKGYLSEDSRRFFRFECSTHEMYWGSIVNENPTPRNHRAGAGRGL